MSFLFNLIVRYVKFYFMVLVVMTMISLKLASPATPARFSQLYANFLQLIKSTFQMMKSSSVS